MSEAGITWDDTLAQKALAAAPQAFRQTMVSFLLHAGNLGRSELVKATPGKAGGEGTLAASWLVILDQRSTFAAVYVRNSQNYVFWVEHGRKPGKMPPYDAIEKWVHRLGLGNRASGAERDVAHAMQGAHKQTAYKERKQRPARKRRTPKPEEELTREEIIFRIRKKIGARGTTPTHFVERTAQAFEPHAVALYRGYVSDFVVALNS